MASKTAASEAPSLRDLSREVEKAAIRARAELDDVRRRLDELRGERELILSAPLHRDDLASELERHLRRKAGEAAQYLCESIAEMRNKSAGHVTVSPDTVANFAPLDKSWLPEVLSVLVDPADAARRLLDAAGELPDVTEGLPLDARREAVRALDARIAAAIETETALVESLRAAGIQVSVENAPTPEPVPGERRIINGRRMVYGYMPGGGATPGWMPASEAA